MCSPNTLTIGVSQSGETKDTLDALFEAKKFGSHLSSFCNVIGSTMARLTGNGAYLHAGPEFAVASHKGFHKHGRSRTIIRPQCLGYPKIRTEENSSRIEKTTKHHLKSVARY